MCRDFSPSLSCVRRAYLRRGNRRSLLLPSNAASSPQSAKEKRGLHSVFLPREIISCPSLDETCISSFFRPLILYLWCVTHGEDTSSTKTRNCWLCQTDIITDDIHLVANTCALRVLPAHEYYLSSIANCQQPRQKHSSIIMDHSKDDSKVGWGRRVDARFATPASRNILGLSTTPLSLDKTFIGRALERSSRLESRLGSSRDHNLGSEQAVLLEALLEYSSRNTDLQIC